MNKITINILCALIIVALGLAIATPLVTFGYQFGQGLMAGYNAVEEDQQQEFLETSPIETIYNPSVDKVIFPTDSITLSDGNTYPQVITEGIVYVPERDFPVMEVIKFIAILANLGLFVWLTVELIKFVVNINRGKVFEAINIKRLKHIAYAIFLVAAVTIADGLCQEWRFSALGLSLEGYDLTANWEFPLTECIIGMLALLMAQVWQRGLNMKQEQELTI